MNLDPTDNSAMARRLTALRANSLAALVMLLIQFALGISVNLYTTLPAADHGKAVFSGFGAAVANGPVTVTAHAFLGTLLLIAAFAAVIRSLRLARTPQITLSAIAVVSILVAWLSGASFIGKQSNGASLSMALAAATAILCYVLIIFITPRRSAPTPGSSVLAADTPAG
jgi:hypothetical protein